MGYLNVINFNEITWLDEDKTTNNSVNVGGNVEVNRDAAEAFGRNLGFAGTVAGVSGATAKVLSKSSLPPVQKFCYVIAASAIGAGIHIAGSGANRIASSTGSSTPSTQVPSQVGGDSTGSNVSDSVTNLMDDSVNNGALMDMLLGINMITYASLRLILSIVILYKFLFFFLSR